jgi:hypothetical protein
LFSELEGETGLADATDTSQRNQPVRPQCLVQRGQLDVAADEAGRFRPQVAGCAVRCQEGRELRSQPLGAHLEDLYWLGDAPHLMGAQVSQLDPAHQPRRRGRDEDLAAMPGRHHPGGAVERRAEVVVTPLLRLARGDAHPHR